MTKESWAHTLSNSADTSAGAGADTSAGAADEAEVKAKTEPVDKAKVEAKVEAESKAKQSWHINPYYFFGFIGLALYAAWLFLSYLNPQGLTVFVNGPLGQADTALGQGTPQDADSIIGWISANLASNLVLMTLVAALALGIAWKFSDYLSTNSGKRLLLILAICTGPLASLSPLLAQFGLAGWSFIPWMLSGLGYAALLLLYSTLLITFEDKRITLFIAATLIAGIAIYIFVASTIPTAAMVFAAALPVLSAICFIVSLRSRRQFIGRKRALIVVSAQESDEKDPIDWRLIADTLTYTPCLGIGIYCSLHDLSYPASIICVGLASIVSCLIIIADTRWLHWLSSKIQLKLFLPLTAVAVFPLSFVGGIAEMVVIFLLFTTFMLSLVTNYSAISLCVQVFELSPIRVFAYGRAFNLLGVAFGYIFAAVAFSSPLASGEGTGTILAFCVLMLVFIIAATFILEDHYPISSDVADSDMDIEPSIPKRDLWDERCIQIAERYGLSTRQAEVFNLLSKGRNTVYIQEKLFISHYTAKAHIYNIYQKIGIHSRQELLDLIEQVEL
ncbi:hypothetical protein FACS1894104_2910 [Actinomycetota bacterium]|nr:hypothetical protein FACS1894104_2910 [Actinomycetota bacterium]